MIGAGIYGSHGFERDDVEQLQFSVVCFLRLMLQIFFFCDSLFFWVIFAVEEQTMLIDFYLEIFNVFIRVDPFINGLSVM